MSIFIPEQYSHVLEIGCAKGQFRLNLPKPCEYWGVELDPMAAKEASEVLDTVLNDSFEKICDDLPNNYFDLIICNDIIEHIDDSVHFLETIKLKIERIQQILKYKSRLNVTQISDVLFQIKA